MLAGFARGVGDGGDQPAADAAALEAGQHVQFGDHEGAVEPAVVAAFAQVRLDDAGPPVGAVVGQSVDEAGQPSRFGVGGQRAGAGTGQVPQHDLPPDRDLLGPEAEADACTARASSTRAARSHGPTTTFSMTRDPIGPSEQDRHERADLAEADPVVGGAGRGVEVVDVEADDRGDVAQARSSTTAAIPSRTGRARGGAGATQTPWIWQACRVTAPISALKITWPSSIRANARPAATSSATRAGRAVRRRRRAARPRPPR